MARVKRTFAPEFKRDAVRLEQSEGKTVSEFSRNLGIARSLLQRWIDQHALQDPDGNPRKSESESEEMKRLRKELRDVAEERDILKKALVDSIGECNIVLSTSNQGGVVRGTIGKTGAKPHAEGGYVAALEARRIPQQDWPRARQSPRVHPRFDSYSRWYRAASSQAFTGCFELGGA